MYSCLTRVRYLVRPVVPVRGNEQWMLRAKRGSDASEAASSSPAFRFPACVGFALPPCRLRTRIVRGGWPGTRFVATVALLLVAVAAQTLTATDAPQLLTVAVDTQDARILRLTFDEDLAEPNAQELSDLRFAFAIQGLYWRGNPILNVSPNVAVSGPTVTLTLNLEAPPGRKVKVSYVASSSGAGLQDTDGNRVASFTTTVTRPARGVGSAGADGGVRGRDGAHVALRPRAGRRLGAGGAPVPGGVRDVRQQDFRHGHGDRQR